MSFKSPRIVITGVGLTAPNGNTLSEFRQNLLNGVGGTGTPTSVLEVIHAVEKVTGKKVSYVTGPRRAGDPPALYADSTKAKTELGWEPQFTTIEPIVASAWKWHSSHPDGFKK